MPTIVIETDIDAPGAICFDLMRDPRVHPGTELEIEGTGRIELGQRVTFVTKPRTLVVEVVKCDRPEIFVDEMVQGPFASFRHVHEFKEINETTRLVDTLIWESPLGVIGKLADKLVETRLRKVVSERNQRLKQLAENR
jgi:ligand-binding SRPBCC domain-containing protein